MLRYPHLTHIQLNHGDSDKVASYSPVFRAYDKDFVAGQAAIDRFKAAGLATAPGFFVIVGRPQVAGVQAARGPVGGLANPTVLYAPTWWGNTQDSNYTSLPKGPEITRALLERGCTVVFRPHPYWDKHHRTAAAREAVVDLLARDAAASGRRHVYGAAAESELSVFDCFNLSDFMVSDVSSVVNDYLFSLKPLVMMAVTATPAQFATDYPVAQAAYIVDYATLDSAPPPTQSADADQAGPAHPADAVQTGPAPGGDPGSRTGAAADSAAARGGAGLGGGGGDGTLAGALDAVFGEDPLAVVRRQLETYYLGDIPRQRYVERFLEEAGKYV
ncbi:MAG: CDP-glycerol glycerophosphotransferase family protein [Bifidobacteriaceae bacterium]|nr:CDP-glycerol glycerophosphotransferase family protein [Bifidobacteriaceae bacterium]